VKLDEWIQIARAVRAQGGAVTPSAVREAALDSGLAAELLAEQAATLSRLGAGLDRASARLAGLRSAAEDPDADRVALQAQDRDARSELLRLRWELTVVKEAMGVRGVRAELDRYWPVPPPLR
jgi:hypothetical protein